VGQFLQCADLRLTLYYLGECGQRLGVPFGRGQQPVPHGGQLPRGLRMLGRLDRPPGGLVDLGNARVRPPQRSAQLLD
jgi:hypothetical protein